MPKYPFQHNQVCYNDNVLIDEECRIAQCLCYGVA